MAEEICKRPPKTLIEEFAKYSTPNISDVLDAYKIKGGCQGLLPIVEGTHFAGPALTVRYLPLGVDSMAREDYMSYARSGDVIVIDNGGRTYCTVWGDLFTLRAKMVGLAGTVIDGVCRDVEAIKKMNYPVFSRGRFMVTGLKRVGVDAFNVPVSISDVKVEPGDIVVADDNGVCIVPNEVAEKVLDEVKETAKAEEYIEKELNKGRTLEVVHTEAKKKYPAYHRM